MTTKVSNPIAKKKSGSKSRGSYGLWLVKQEPESYSWDDLTRDGRTDWTGVRNFQARNNLRQMKPGDRVLFYHSGTGKYVVGIAEVVKAAYPDPTANDPQWVAVDLKPVKSLKKPVPLYFVYITAWATEDGIVQFRRDLYQKDGIGETAAAY